MTLLEFLHLGSQYHVTNGQLSTQMLVTKGVRQGCKAAPLLWTVLVYELFQQLQCTTGSQWIRDFVTAFADDFNIACPIHSSDDLGTHLRCIGQLLDLLKSFGLKVNPEKCTVLLTLRGSTSKTVLQQYTCWHNGKYHLNIPCVDGYTLMPIDTTAQYLGVTISYTNTAALTMQQRLKQAIKCFGRLRCWLRSTSKVNMQARFQLWQRTVVPTLTYGLGATGLTTHGVVAICTEIHRQLRTIAGDHAYRTHNTNQAVLQRFGWPTAPDLLEAAITSMQSTVYRRRNHLQQDDILWNTDWTILEDSLAVLRQVKTRLMSTDDAAIPSALCQFPCQLCNRHFTSSLGLYIHRQKAHKIHQRYWTKFTPAHDAVNTVPTCTHCHQSFTTWRELKAHVARHTESQILKPQRSEAAQTQVLYEQLLASDRGSVVIQALRTHDWARLTQPLRTWLSSHCVLCDVHMISVSAIYHTKQHHASCADTVLRNAPILWREIGATTPCKLCGGSFVSERTCPAAHQLALLMHLDPDQESMALQRPQTTGLSYIQSRDAVPGTSAKCAHCKKDFAGFGGLRKHILKRACYAFDPNRAQTLLPVNTGAMAMLHNGTLQRFLHDAQDRMQWTLNCQQCAASFVNSSSLLLHLQTQHATLFDQATNTTIYLSNLITTNWRCVCNPVGTGIKIDHQCAPLRQLAMRHVRWVQRLQADDVNQRVPLPFAITAPEADMQINPTLSAALKDTLVKALVDRDIDSLLRDPAVQHAATQCCLFCDDAAQTTDLRAHLRHAHNLDHRSCAPLVHTLIDCLQPTCHNFCPLCEHALQETAQTHLVQCLVLHQIVFLLHTTQNGHSRFLGGCESGGRRADDRGVQELVQTPGQVSLEDPGAIPKRRRTSQQEDPQWGWQQTPRQEQRQGQAGQTVPEACGSEQQQPYPVPADSSCAASGTAAKEHVGGVMLGGLRPAGHVEHDAAGDPDLEGCGRSTEGDHATSKSPVAGTMRALADTGHQDLSDRSPKPRLFGVHQSTHSDQRRHLAGSTMGPQGQAVRLGAFANNTDAADVETADSTERSGKRKGSDPQLPQSQAVDGSVGERGALETPSDAAQSRCLVDPSWTSPQLGLETCRSPSETLQPEAISTHGRVESNAEMMLQLFQSMPKAEICGLMQHVKLLNDDNHCYSNASLLSCLWAMLSRRSFTLGDLGRISMPLSQILHTRIQSLQSVALSAYMPTLFDTWHEKHRHGEQGDPGEFISHMLQQGPILAVNMAWEKRVQVNAGNDMNVTQIEDVGTSLQPLLLRPITDDQTEVSLQQAMNAWGQDDGMRRALQHASNLLVCQFERLSNVQGLSRRSCKLIIDNVCEVPVFSGPGLHTAKVPYIPVCLMRHIGGTDRGHYDAALKIGAGRPLDSFVWAVMDDNSVSQVLDAVPEEIDGLRKDYGQGITHVWLCRMDDAELWQPLSHQLARHCARERIEAWKTAGAKPSEEALANVLQILKNTDYGTPARSKDTAN